MKRLTLASAAVTCLALSGMVAPVEAAGCLPPEVPGGDTLCNYLAIPQSTCRGIVNQPNVPQQVKDARLCEKVPNGTSSTGQDANIAHLGQGTVVPNDAVKVGIGRNIYLHNFDATFHSFTDPGCMDSLPATPCRFDRTLLVGEWGFFARVQLVSSANFTVGNTYSFRCRYHGGETGTFEVTA